MQKSTAENVKVARDEKAWEIEVRAEIPAESLARYRQEALEELQKTAKLDGFRPGHAPAERIIAIYGEAAVLRQAAERAIQAELPEILAKENVLIADTPRVETNDPIRQLAEGKPLAFSARAPLPPHITLPDWRAIAKKHNEKRQEASVSDDEFAQAQTHIRRERARIEKTEQGEEAGQALEAARALPEADLPPLDDEFAKALGYENEATFLESLKASIKNEKELQQKQRLRNAILDELVKESSIRYPATLKEYELDDMEGRIRDDLARFGGGFEQYLEQIKKTREELRNEWQEAADKRAKTRLILAEIARKEKIAADEAAVEAELKHAKEQYKNASEANLRAGIAQAMRNEKVLELLEKQ